VGVIDEAVLWLQSAIDRAARWARFGGTRHPSARRYLMVQIDGLSARVFDHGLATRRLPMIAWLLRTGRLQRRSMSVGLPSSTPAFQASVMYGVQPDIPGFHFYDKRTRMDLHFPRAGVADLVEQSVAAGRRGILEGGACFGCVFTGGAEESFLTFSRLLRPTRAGLPLLRPLLSITLIAWVFIKCLVLTILEVGRFALQLLFRPRAAAPSGLRGLGLKVGFSIWIREFFTLAVSADLYRGVPAIYVNYLDYDVFAHAFGPGHPASMRALRRLDRSIGQLVRVIRRLPELGYDLYICSDHGQTLVRSFDVVAGQSIVDVVAEMVTETARTARRDGARARSPFPPRTQVRGTRERFFNHPERDAIEANVSNESGSVHVIAAGPNAFVYFTDVPEPLVAEEIEQRYPELMARLSAHPGMGFVLARSAAGPVCWWRGRRFPLDGSAVDGPFAARADRDVVLEGLRHLMAMPSAGDLVLYGIGAPGGDVSFIDERGAHAGPSEDELHTFILHPAAVPLPGAPLTHPVQLYPHFLAYRDPTQSGDDGQRDRERAIASQQRSREQGAEFRV
jgi:hypothetical protein